MTAADSLQRCHVVMFEVGGMQHCNVGGGRDACNVGGGRDACNVGGGRDASHASNRCKSPCVVGKGPKGMETVRPSEITVLTPVLAWGVAGGVTRHKSHVTRQTSHAKTNL
jgi:hypothetical protein